jgi:hypothetical protein
MLSHSQSQVIIEMVLVQLLGSSNLNQECVYFLKTLNDQSKFEYKTVMVVVLDGQILERFGVFEPLLGRGNTFSAL